jgi:Holliday junction resolvasome RuvABC ATP-dependent DNA helicase subunit
VGGTRNLFDTASLLAVYYFSGGIPRIINTLCDGALVFAYGQQKETVDLNIVMDVVRTKQIGGIHRTGLDGRDRETVRAYVKTMNGIDLLELVGY